MSEALPELKVVAGLLRDSQARVLLTQRPPGREDAGLWEFPGGKLEPGESALMALTRELQEELGITIDGGTPLIRVPQRQPHRMLWLDAIEVRAWRGEPHALDAQALSWMHPEDIDPRTLPAADRPILACLLQPPCYWITPDLVDSPDAFDRLLAEAHAGSARRLQLRAPMLAPLAFAALARHAAERASALGIELLLNAGSHRELALAAELGCGAQLRQALLMQLRERPPLRTVGASCHDQASLGQAERLACDFALLSPVRFTHSHPETPALGWDGFSALRACTSLPVYALGGVTPADLPIARTAGAQGVAGIRGFFRLRGPCHG